MGLEIPCWEEDAIWKQDDAAVFEKAIAPLEKHGFLKRSDVEEFFTVRLGHVYPVWDIDFEKNLGVLLDYEKKIDNLIFNGRPGPAKQKNRHDQDNDGDNAECYAHFRFSCFLFLILVLNTATVRRMPKIRTLILIYRALPKVSGLRVGTTAGGMTALGRKRTCKVP